MVMKWIDQMDDWDQSSACYGYQCLEREVFHSSKPGNEAATKALARALAAALVEKRKAAGKDKPAYKHTVLARNQLARLIGYIPTDDVLAELGETLRDFDVREMARYALDSNHSEGATRLLADALAAPGSVFRVGVVNSLGRRPESASAKSALKKAAGDPQPEVRIAAREALAGIADASADAAIEKGTQAENPGERRQAYSARARLVQTLVEAGRLGEARSVADSILASDAGEAQKRAASNVLA